MNAPPPALFRSEYRPKIGSPIGAIAVDRFVERWATGCRALGQSFFLSGNGVKSLGEFSKRLRNLDVMGRPAERDRWNAA
ncbi:hypothetical protein ACFYO2_13275 [Streptomyces sp. NPDC006602]|uniref:hypothetical protein n=1 Tax=Streptomyces sp. NPDC006602 TaxID=3364751 RepID=UPI00368E18D6